MAFGFKSQRNGADIGNAPYGFEWKPQGGDLDEIPGCYIAMAEKLLERELVSIDRELDSNGKIRMSFRAFCSGNTVEDENGSRTEYDMMSSEETVVGLRDEGKLPGNSRQIAFSTDYRPIKALSGACPGCNAHVCPYVVAGRLKYLRDTGKEASVVPSSLPEKGIRPEILKEGDFGFELKKIFFESLSKVSDRVFEIAKAMTDRGCVTLGKKLLKDGEGRYHVNVFCAFDYEEFADSANSAKYLETALNGTKMTVWETSVLAPDDDDPEWKKILCTAAVLSCSRAIGKNLTPYIEDRAARKASAKELAGRIQGLDRILGVAGRDNTTFLRFTVEGYYEAGRRNAVEKIAAVLADSGKILTPDVFEVSFGELAHEFTEYTEAGELSDPSDYKSHHDHYAGFISRSFEPRKMYMVTGLSDFLRNRDEGNDSTDIKRHEMLGLLRTLGSVEKDTYVAVVGYRNEIDKFLAIDSRISFLFGANRLVYPEMDLGEIYKMYVAGLSPDVAAKITDEKANEAAFRDYLTFNSRAIPFDNDELADYLAGYSNSEGEPVLPPGVYDSGKLKKTLERIVGMNAVKEQLFKFRDYISFRKKAEAENLKLPDANLHMLFTGNAGTGKTMIARIVSTMLYEIGFISRDKLVEVERKDLVAAYLGQTAGKTSEKIDEATPGVLFIDEAYTLAGDAYGEEAIATLLKAMEDRRNELVVIFAGYPDLMQKFLDSNPGLASRLGYRFHFDDYTAEELMAMLEMKSASAGITMSDGAKEKAAAAFKYFVRRKNFGNGRFVDTLWQEMLIQHAVSLTDGNLTEISEKDVPSVRSLSTRRSSGTAALKLEDLVGLAQVKEQVKRFRTKVTFENRAREYGVEIPRGNSHMMFVGNAGTGKTTVARILVDELYEAGVILEKKLIEVTAKDLIAEYVGQTSPKTQAVIDRAMGGVLFTKQAYQPAAGGDLRGSYGQDAVATLIKAMEDSKDQFVVIFAGYEREMQDFLAMNTGIASRIGYTFRFEDYDADALTEIYRMKINRAGLSFGDGDADARVRALMQYFSSVSNFGNGRFAEKVAEATYAIHAENCEGVYDADRLVTVTAADIPSVEYMIALMPDGGLIKPSEITTEQNRRTAVHERGHALLTMPTFPNAVMDTSTIAAEGNGALGYVSSTGMLGANSTYSELEGYIQVLMAGIAAEKVFLGEYANGGTSDLEKATDVAWNMISRFGMSEKGFAVKHERDEAAGKELNDILGKQFLAAEARIGEYRERLEEAADRLMKSKSISKDELAAVLGL
ncbi:MAG: AAA family ATPase [Clostridia bacterium]|nr:AAA family ATPase [Clostridia bacterium]